MNYEDTSKEALNKHIDHIIDICKSIPMDKITILTGGNAMGKSLIRKQLPFTVSKEKKVSIDKSVASISMQCRTENRGESWSALGNVLYDLPWLSTSEHTVHLLNSLLKDAEDRFIVIDELEIGMSREVQAGTCMMLNEKLDEIKDKLHGVLVITHSEDVVKNLKHDNFINIEGMSEEEWLNREIVPVNPSILSKWTMELFKAVEDRTKK